MEACFLSSNSLSKITTDLIPASLVKANPFSSSKIRNRSSLQPHRTNFPRFSSASICCQSGRSSSASNDDDDGTPTVSGDWRSFRARLVAAEHLSPSPSSAHADNQIRPIVGEKWAHPIPEPEKGCLLVATEKLDGVHIFERTVILLLSTGPVGPTGIILNRPSLMSIKETRSSVFDVAGTFSDRPLYFGGPLEEALFLLGGGGGPANGVFDEVMDGLYYGTKESVGCAAEMVKRRVVGLEDFRFFDGYCGWEKQQLRDEISAGFWAVVACSPSVVGLQSSRGLWEEVLGLMVPRKVW